jgi:hypothetical protein
MKATLSFNLDNPDERQAHLRAIKSTDMAAVLWELVHNTHKKMHKIADQKAYEQDEIDCYQMIDEFYMELHSLLEANSIDIDDLY